MHNVSIEDGKVGWAGIFGRVDWYMIDWRVLQMYG